MADEKTINDKPAPKRKNAAGEKVVKVVKRRRARKMTVKAGVPEKPREHHQFDHLDQVVLENMCINASRGQIAARKEVQFFMGVTADDKGKGHALMEVRKNGEMITHWGTFDDHAARLKPFIPK